MTGDKNSMMNTAINMDGWATFESKIVGLLGNRYGDGIVYLPKGEPKTLYNLLVKEQYISDEGYITRKGRAFLARRS